MSLQTLISNLEKLEKMHKSLLELAFKKTEIVKNGDMEQLDDITKQEQTHVAAIETLEQQRQMIVTDYLRAKGIAHIDTPTVADVIDAANNEEERKQLKDVRNRLLLVIDDLQRQNELNQTLIFQSLQFVNMTLDLLRPRAEQINYSNKNNNPHHIQKNSMFDSQI